MTTSRKDFVANLPVEDFARMKILAHAQGLAIKTESEVWRIIYLADMFRGILSSSKIQREKEAAENRQSVKRPRR
jgi:hypothetical protein